MNPEIPQEPTDDIEYQLTAYLLGELNAEDTAKIESELGRNPALRKLKTELEFTMGLVRDVVRTPAESESNTTVSERPQLSHLRRNALLDNLRQAPVIPMPKAEESRETKRWMIPMAIAASLVGILSLHELTQAPLLLRSKKLTSIGTNTEGSSESTEAALDSRGLKSESKSRSLFRYTLEDGASRSNSSVLADTPRFSKQVNEASNEPAQRSLTAQAPGSRSSVALGVKSSEAPILLTPSDGITLSDVPTSLHDLDAKDVPPFVTTKGSKLSGALPQLTYTPPANTEFTLGFVSESVAGKADQFDAQANPGIRASENGRGENPKPLDPVVASMKSGPAMQNEILQRESLEKRKATGNPTPATAAVESDAVAELGALVQLENKTPVELELLGQTEGDRLSFSIEKNLGENVSRYYFRLPVESWLSTPPSVTNGSGVVGRSASKASTNPTSPAIRPGIAGTKSEAADIRDAVAETVAQQIPNPQPEIPTSTTAFSTFSLNVSDVSFKLAAASLQAGSLPAPTTVRTEEFINAFHYRDPEPASGQPMAFAWDRAASPFAQNQDLLRFSIKTAATGRESGRPVNLVLLLDKSGSMERPDRVVLVREALNSLATQLKPQDRLSVVTFARTPRLVAEAAPTDLERVKELARRISDIPAEGGTNLEEAMKLGYSTALKQFLREGLNRVVLLTDGAANLGEVEASSLQGMVDSWRQRGIALDCFGVGWEGLNDSLLATLASHGDGRYGLINTAEDAESNFASQLAGALHVAASDVKVQVEFNPQRVSTWRQLGYATHQLTQEQFRDNTVDAAELAAAEAGNALYSIQVLPQGSGPIATVRARFRDPITNTHRELSWSVPYNGSASPLESSSSRMRLAATAGSFAEWLSQSPHAGEISPTRLLHLLRGVPTSLSPDTRPALLETMLRQAQSLTGK